MGTKNKGGREVRKPKQAKKPQGRSADHGGATGARREVAGVLRHAVSAIGTHDGRHHHVCRPSCAGLARRRC